MPLDLVHRGGVVHQQHDVRRDRRTQQEEIDAAGVVFGERRRCRPARGGHRVREGGKEQRQREHTERKQIARSEMQRV